MNKIYILVHSWLAPANRAVQAAHVVQGWAEAEAGLSIVLLETGKSKPQMDLSDAVGTAHRIGLPLTHFKPFVEEDACNGGQCTAVGFILDSDMSTLPETIHAQMLLHLSKFRLAS